MTKPFLNIFHSQQIQAVLARLHAEARVADQPFIAQAGHMTETEWTALQSDYRKLYGLAREAFLPVGEKFWQLLYLLARTCRATSIVEFGTSFGISTIYLASALRDNGGGKLITCELEPTKSKRAQKHLAEAGLAELVEFRVGDALALLGHDLAAPVDLLLLDGAKPLYFQILKLVEPHLRSGALVAADNIGPRHKVNEFTDYVGKPGNGYISVELPLEEGDGIEISLRL